MPPITGTPEQEAESITLISSDGFEYHLKAKVACQSKILAMFLDSTLGFQESLTRVIHMPDINNKLLGRLCDFLQYKHRYQDSDTYPPWDIGAEESLDLLLAADYLDM